MSHPIKMVMCFVLSMALASCVQMVENHRGYRFSDHVQINEGQGKDAVVRSMGSPTMISGFDKNVWYYIAIDTVAISGQIPKKMTSDILEIHFDPYYEIVRSAKRYQHDCKLVYVPDTQAKDLETYHLLSSLEKAASSIQPTPIK